MACLTKALIFAAGVAAAIGFRSELHKVEAPHCSRGHLRLVVNTDGSIDLGGHHYSDQNAIFARFSQMAAQEPQPNIRLKTNRTSPYDKVAAVLALAQKAGLECFGFTGIEQQPDP